MLTKNKNPHSMNHKQDVTSFQDKHASAELPRHTLFHSIWLSLLPGVLILLFAIIVEPLIARMGLPLLLIPSLWVLCVIIPVELGYLYSCLEKEHLHRHHCALHSRFARRSDLAGAAVTALPVNI
jgi:hypothetical protein